MSSFCLVSNSGFVGNPKSYRIYALRSKPIDKCICRSYSSRIHSNFLREVVCCSKIGSISDGSRKNEVALLEDRESIDRKKRFFFKITAEVEVVVYKIEKGVNSISIQ
ncbi:Tryptophan--tRNA ligase [Bienertia sinuspersici]